MAKQQFRYQEDPSIAQCAALEFERLWGMIEAGTSRGTPFYVAREKVLAHEIPRISKAYGNVVADRVSKHVQWRGPRDLAKGIQDAAMHRANQRIIEYTKTRRKNGRLNWFDRFGIWLCGCPLI
jgi:hypothetical protein